MIISLAKWRKRFVFTCVFILLSYSVYVLIGVSKDWLEKHNRYKPPNGKATKVIQQEQLSEVQLTMRDRLLLFYQMGE